MRTPAMVRNNTPPNIAIARRFASRFSCRTAPGSAAGLVAMGKHLRETWIVERQERARPQFTKECSQPDSADSDWRDKIQDMESRTRLLKHEYHSPVHIPQADEQKSRRHSRKHFHAP